jgi:hypothetical protein
VIFVSADFRMHDGTVEIPIVSFKNHDPIVPADSWAIRVTLRERIF